MSLYGNVTQVPQSTGAPAPITVPNTTPVFSRTFKLYYGQAFGVWGQAGNGSGTANMKIELEQSYKDLTEAEQGSANSAYVIGDGVAPIQSNLMGNTAFVKTVSPVPMKYGRYKITGQGSNPADATITLWNFIQELIA